MRGGLFTVDGGDAWAAVLEMMRCPGASLSVISYDSLYGFIFLLTIPEDNPSCVKFKDERGNMVFKIVFKIVLLGDPKKVRLHEFNGEYKSVMTENSFVNESNNQKTFFSKTNMNKKPITLGVACHEVFRKNTFSNDIMDAKYTNFITHLNTFKKNDDPDNIINYIDGCMTTRIQLTYSGHIQNESEIIYGIGIIVMNFAGNYISDTENFNMTTLSDAIHIYENIYQTNTNNIIQQNSQYAINKCYEYAIANLLILLLEFKVVPTDAHTSNFMAMFFKNSSTVPIVSIELNKLDSYLDVKMIDLAYLLKISDINEEYKQLFNGTINHSFPPVYSWGQQIFTDYYTSYIQELISHNVETLSTMTNEKIITMMHHFVIVIALIDAIKKSIVKKRQSDITPQCSFMLYYLVGSVKMNDLILTNPIVDENIQHKYLNIFERMKSIILTTSKDNGFKENGNRVKSVIKSSATSTRKIGRKRDNSVNKYSNKPFSVNL